MFEGFILIIVVALALIAWGVLKQATLSDLTVVNISQIMSGS